MVNGNTDLNGRLDVSGDVSFNGNLHVTSNISSSEVFITDTTPANGIMYLQSTDGTNPNLLTENGNITVTESGNLTASATGAGVITANSFNATSDYRIKENIQTINGDILTVDNIRPVSYRLKSNQKSTLGFIAHELQEHVPTAVSGEKDGETMQSVDYNQIIPILVKEIQELKKRVTYLEQNQK